MVNRMALAAGLAACLLAAGAGFSQERATEGDAGSQRASRTSLERRIVELEGQLTRLSKEIQELRAQLGGRRSQPKEATIVRIMPLRHAEAAQLAAVLREQVKGEAEVRIVVDPRTNSLLLTGTPEQVNELEGLAHNLDTPKPAAEK